MLYMWFKGQVFIHCISYYWQLLQWRIDFLAVARGKIEIMKPGKIKTMSLVRVQKRYVKNLNSENTTKASVFSIKRCWYWCRRKATFPPNFCCGQHRTKINWTRIFQRNINWFNKQKQAMAKVTPVTSKLLNVSFTIIDRIARLKRTLSIGQS
jgi:hypothetical protein